MADQKHDLQRLQGAAGEITAEAAIRHKTNDLQAEADAEHAQQPEPVAQRPTRHRHHARPVRPPPCNVSLGHECADAGGRVAAAPEGKVDVAVLGADGAAERERGGPVPAQQLIFEAAQLDAEDLGTPEVHPTAIADESA